MYGTEEWSAMFLISIMLLFNFFSVFSIIAIFTGKVYIDLTRLELTIALVIYGFIHYFLFIFNGRFKNILKRFQDESTEAKRKMDKFTLLYIIGSIVVLFGSNLIKILIWGTP